MDDFVSVNASDEEGTLTTKRREFLGDTWVVNANANGGLLTVEALDADGRVIEGFCAADCTPITTDCVRHVLKITEQGRLPPVTGPPDQAVVSFDACEAVCVRATDSQQPLFAIVRLELVNAHFSGRTSDARDASGNNRHGAAQAVEFAATGAAFNGRSSRIDVADAPQLATDDFSISLWVYTEAQLDDAVGDLISQYDSAARTGSNLSIKHHAGGKVFRYAGGQWVDLGQLLGLDGVQGIAEFRDKLYVTGFYQPALSAEFVKKTAMMR